ncbi:hypothetical protein [Paracoccus sp. 22332]|uniref:hypothetical protein n=1 Tax=Paracoccus sp. 22332 TaxID=3453913 RepID=UPI003F82F9B7
MSPNRFATRFAFSADDLVIIEGRPMRLGYRNSEGCTFEPVNGGLVEHFSHPEIAALQRANKLEMKGRHFVAQGVRHVLDRADSLHSMIDGTMEERIRYRESLVLGFKQVQRTQLDQAGRTTLKRTDASISAHRALITSEAKGFYAKTAAPAKAPAVPDKFTPRSLRRWLSLYDAMGRAGLADRHQKSGNREARFPSEIRAILSKAVEYYLSPNRPTKKKVHENVLIAVSDLNEDRHARGLPPFDAPSRNAVSAEIDRQDPFQVAVAREGREAAMRKLRQTGQGLSPGLTRPAQRVEMDEMKIDLFTIFKDNGFLDLFSEKDRERLGLDGKKGRWWVTMAICATTKVILGMRLTRNPNHLAALECLQMCLNDKGSFADAVGALSPWSMAALMELLVTDAGAAFKATDLRTACADLGIRKEIAIAGLPHLRGCIERMFRTLNLSC